MFHAMRGCSVRAHLVHIYAKQVLCVAQRGLGARTTGRMRAIVVRARMRAYYAVRMLVIPGAAVITMQSGIQTLAVVHAWQFVLEIDTVLFESFAPRSLKGALAKSAELVTASLPTFHGLDLAPVLKLIAALTMVGCLVGTIIMPQNSLLDAVKLTLCGTPCLPTPAASIEAPTAPHRFGVRRRIGQLGVE